MWTEAARRSAEAIASAKRPPSVETPRTPDGERELPGPLERHLMEALGGLVPITLSVVLIVIGLALSPPDGTALEVGLALAIPAVVMATLVAIELVRGEFRSGEVRSSPDFASFRSDRESFWRGVGRGALFYPIPTVNIAFSLALGWPWRLGWLVFLVGASAVTLVVAARAARAERRAGARLYVVPAYARRGPLRGLVFREKDPTLTGPV